jgi:hypothetical protein
MCAWISARYRDLPALHCGAGPGQTPAGKHCNADVLRSLITTDLDVPALRADFGNGNLPDPQVALKIFGDPGGGLGQRLKFRKVGVRL